MIGSYPHDIHTVRLALWIACGLDGDSNTNVLLTLLSSFLLGVLTLLSWLWDNVILRLADQT